MSTNRFAKITDGDLDQLDASKDSMNTQRCVKSSVALFRQFLGEENRDFERLSKPELNKQLRLFFASVRTRTGDELKKSSLNAVRYGLSKYLKERCDIDIKTDKEFASCTSTFKAKLTDLQKKGKGSVEHKSEIREDDLQKLRDPRNIVFDTETPCGLQKKVWFDIMFFLCRRGRENQRSMTKTTFTISKDSSGKEFVHQVTDEADKNHGADSTPDDTVGEARMYSQGDDMCPVKSFKKYVSKLHPDIPDLWQRPLETFDDSGDVWYCKVPIGKNTLGNMMREISEIGGLSQRYTNHCIRATSISALDRAGYEARHIIRASGHKSESSIRSYSRRLTEGKKRDMSETLSNAFNSSVGTCRTTSPSSTITEPASTSSLSTGNENILPAISEEDLLTIFSDDNMFVEVSDAGQTSNSTGHPASTMAIPQPPTQNFSVSSHAASQIIYPTSVAPTYNINPNMSNCTVNFHFYGK